jgi:hypothetical protein
MTSEGLRVLSSGKSTLKGYKMSVSHDKTPSALDVALGDCLAHYYDSESAKCVSVILFQAGLEAGDRLIPLDQPFDVENSSPVWIEARERGVHARALKAVALLALVPVPYCMVAPRFRQNDSPKDKDMPETLEVLWNAIIDGLIQNIYKPNDNVERIKFFEALVLWRDLSPAEREKRKALFPKKFERIRGLGASNLIQLLRRSINDGTDNDVVRMILRSISHSAYDEDLVKLLQRK